MCCSSGESELKFGNKKLDRGMKAEDICQKNNKNVSSDMLEVYLIYTDLYRYCIVNKSAFHVYVL